MREIEPRASNMHLNSALPIELHPHLWFTSWCSLISVGADTSNHAEAAEHLRPEGDGFSISFTRAKR